MTDIWSKIGPPKGGTMKMQIGEVVSGEVMDITLERDPFDDTGQAQVVRLVINDREIICHPGLHRELFDRRIQPGQHIRVERIADTPLGGGRKMAAFTVDVAAQPEQQRQGPSW
jgi:hypothetical protein